LEHVTKRLQHLQLGIYELQRGVSSSNPVNGWDGWVYDLIKSTEDLRYLTISFHRAVDISFLGRCNLNRLEVFSLSKAFLPLATLLLLLEQCRDAIIRIGFGFTTLDGGTWSDCFAKMYELPRLQTINVGYCGYGARPHHPYFYGYEPSSPPDPRHDPDNKSFRRLRDHLSSKQRAMQLRQAS
jgi:hypothetical protein